MNAMTTWIHRLTRVEDGETVLIPDAEFVLNYTHGDPAGYKDKKKHRDWIPDEYEIPDELFPAVGLFEMILLQPEGPAGRTVNLRDVLALNKDGKISVKIGDKEWELKSVED